MKKIPLTKGKFAIVDDEDYDWLNQWKWCDDGAGYAMRRQYLGGGQANPRFEKIKMHRLILDAPKGIFVDHVNGNRADNRRSNIRLATDWQNGANRGANRGKKSNPYKGVYQVKGQKGHKEPARPWWALIVESSTGEKKRRSLGCYATPEEAALAYNEAARLYFGDFAYLNEV